MTTPEITGYSRNPAGIWNNRKSFAAGNRLSSNAVTIRPSSSSWCTKTRNECDETIVYSKENIGALYQDYRYQLIDQTPETEEAGYFDERELYKQAQVWYGPTADEKNFYFSAFQASSSSPSAQNNLPSILTSRKRENGEANWSRNTQKYYTDLGLNPPQYPSLCRTAPAIYGDSLYITDNTPTPGGPVVFAVDKNTGDAKWAVLLEGDLRLTVTKLGNLNITVSSVNGKPNLFVGVSSLQNTDESNIGIQAGRFPIYTDQGYLFRVQDNGNSGELITSIPTCAPLLAVGDLVTTDSFLPGRNSIIIATVAESTISNVYVFTDNPNIPKPQVPNIPENPIPIAAKYVIEGIATEAIFQQAFLLTNTIFLGNDRTRTYTREELLVIFNTTPGTYTIYAYLPEDQKAVLESQVNNGGVAFFKEIFEGPIENERDAQGLNYYGNGTWGAPVTIAQDDIYFGTGQSHWLPFEELAYYHVNERNFLWWKERVNVASTQYQIIPTSENLQQLNTIKREFERRMIEESNDLSGYSPRGLLSYSDAVFDVTVGLTKKWAQRTIPSDVFTFNSNPYEQLLGYWNIIDGDVCTGIQLFNFSECDKERKVVATAPKTGFGVVIDVSGEQGVFRFNTYLGKADVFGGANYQCTQSLGSLLFSNQFNSVAFAEGGPPFVSNGGEIIPSGTSYNTALNVNTGVVEWNASLDAQSLAQVANVNGILLCCDLEGNLYAQDDFSGKRLLKFDTKTSSAPGSGISSACVLADRILWSPAYKVLGATIGAQYGASYKIDECAILGEYSLESLEGNTYISTSLEGIEVHQKWTERGLLVTIPSIEYKAKFEIKENKCGEYEFILKYKSDPLVTIRLSNLRIYSGLRYQLLTKIEDVEWDALYEIEFC